MFVHVECYLILELRIWSVYVLHLKQHTHRLWTRQQTTCKILVCKTRKNKTQKKPKNKNNQKNPKKQPNRHKKEGFVGQRNSMESRNYMYIDKLDLGRYITTLIKVHCIQNWFNILWWAITRVPYILLDDIPRKGGNLHFTL